MSYPKEYTEKLIEEVQELRTENARLRMEVSHLKGQAEADRKLFAEVEQEWCR